MSNVAFATLFVLGAGVLALWFNVRFPWLCPRGLRRAFLHIFAGMVILNLRTVLEAYAAPDFGSPAATTIGALFLFTLPALTYFLLGVTWTIRIAQSMLGGRPG